MRSQFHGFNPYTIDPRRAQRIRQLKNSQKAADSKIIKSLYFKLLQKEAADNNDKKAIEDEVESSDKAECQRNSQWSRVGRLIMHKRLKVCNVCTN